uniref:G-protein coupled receptors family 1 profile domain-containing protein n=1 Tax=Periophthalmus magnuspinnatus TaxID=409849 RepID=A0A3B4AS45_9GOBI
MDNETWDMDVLLLEGLRVDPGFSLAAFLLLLLVYIFILVSNVGLVLLIFAEKTLRTPMYLLFCNLILNDVFGATIIIPHVLLDISSPSDQRRIPFSFCALQAFCVNLYGSTSHTVLMAMAFDRYVAICNPLRYSSIMSPGMVLRLSLASWGSTLVMVAVLLGLTLRLSRCRRVVPNLFCDNASLFKLSCDDLTVNNVFGLVYTVLLLGSSLLAVSLTYFKIACVCLRRRSATLNRRALHTCASHLCVYLLLLVSAFAVVTLHRFPKFSEQKKVVSVVGEVLLPALNALIYGVQIRQIRARVGALFCRKKPGLNQD